MKILTPPIYVSGVQFAWIAVSIVTLIVFTVSGRRKAVREHERSMLKEGKDIA